ncbi:MAG: hypothetical protein K2I40_03945, partial [Bifidobacterium castoris]|nr:hypothetical protein [Bifidobacterium castoris]
VCGAAVHPYTHTGRDGRRWDMMGVTIPEGVRLQDVDLGGWRLSAFADRRSSADKANGGPVTISFRPDRPVDLYRGRGPGRETMRIDDPWDLCCAVKAGRGQRAAAPAPPRTPADDMFADYVDILRGEYYTPPHPGMPGAAPPAPGAPRFPAPDRGGALTPWCQGATSRRADSGKASPRPALRTAAAPARVPCNASPAATMNRGSSHGEARRRDAMRERTGIDAPEDTRKERNEHGQRPDTAHVLGGSGPDRDGDALRRRLRRGHREGDGRMA